MVVASLLLGGVAGCAGRSPEAIVLKAAEAAGDNDFDTYAACFTPRSRALLEAFWMVLGRQHPDWLKLNSGKVTISGVAQIADSRDETSRAIVMVEEGRDSMPIVVHGAVGAWRIDLFDTERELLARRLRF